MIRTERRMRICITLICMMLAFIWGNSMLPGAISQKISDWVEAVLRGVCSEEMEAFLSTWLWSGDPLVSGGGWLRKLAHFLEFGSLGMCFGWLFGMLKKKSAWPLLCGVLAACIDESIQLITPDRGPSIRDVGIDSCGVITGIALIYLGHALLRKRKQSD